MPQNPRPPQDKVEYLRKKILKHKDVVGRLKDTPIWNTIVEEFLKSRKEVDNAWSYVKPESLDGLRIQRQAIDMVLSILGYHERLLDKFNEQIAEESEVLHSGESPISKDYQLD